MVQRRDGELERYDEKDFKDIEVSEEEWYDEAVRSRVGWSTLC